MKICERCKLPYERRRGLSNLQWEGRKYCSKKCSATKIRLSDSEICQLYLNNLSSTEVGLKAGISGTQVLRILRGNNIKTREDSERQKLAKSRPGVIEKMRLSSTGRRLSEQAKEKLRQRIGSKNANWGGGLSISAEGYIVFTSSKANGELAGIALHTVIGEWLYGKSEGGHIHHIDGDKLNNHPENLILLSASEHLSLHAKENNLGKHNRRKNNA